MIRCEVDHDIHHDSDHLPIVTSLHLATAELQREKKRNCKAIDDSALDRYVEAIFEAVSTAIEASVPAEIPSLRSRTGWSEACKNVLAKTRRLRRTYSDQYTEESWEAYRAAKNSKSRIVRKALQQAHREAVEIAVESIASPWRIAKWARNTQNQSPIATPEIQNHHTPQTATAPEEKRALFNAVHIYVDGSGIDCQIGAAACCTATKETSKSHIGD
ncbi:zinc knuckle [Colletotrichum lupini]|uniref:Zinc knuckle n=1 Tax=Colletotrichum lupini TaxID=145971 RepID=A0A9Q8SD45_9PEZI|nr:zinc knuckle [Colletotrichum lupini]UQC75196.1 zinc knuckle [Colletotrichum lupini]